MTSTHQLAAIMFTDLVGYTTLMGESEEKAFRLLEINRKLQKTHVEKYGGKYLKEMGDGVLASFDSASKAVYCAGAIQKAARKEDGLNLRIGIHLGDVVFKDGDIFGDGVNIASRIEPMAEAGGIAVSEPVYRNVKNKEGIQTEFLAEKQLKNVEEPIRIYRISIDDSISDASSVPPVKKKNAGPKRRMTVPLIGILVIVLGYFLYQNVSSNKSNSNILADTYSSIAVLPFADLSPDGDQEYLGDGIAEEIINVLTRIDDLKVIGRTSSFSFKRKDDDLTSIGNKLGVSTLLEGSIRKSDNQIRVTAQLIDVKDGSHLWSETYDRELKDIFVIQDEISAMIAEKFKLTLTLSREESPPTTDLEAYEMFLRGRQLFNLGLAGTKEALILLEKAVELDPTFLAAHSELHMIYWSMGFYGLGDRMEFYEKSRKAALKAIEIDPDSYLGYSGLAWVNFTIDWDWTATMKNFNKAVERGLTLPDPDYAFYQAALYGDFEESVNIMKEALIKDPLSIEKKVELSRVYLYARRYEDVIRHGEEVIILSPGNTSIMRHMGLAYLYIENSAKALEIFETLMEIDSTYAPYGYIGSLVKLGRVSEAEDVFRRLPNSLNPVKKAICYIHFEELDSAFKYLDQAYLEKNIWMAFLKAEPSFETIKDDSRFLELVERMKFPTE